MSSTDNLKSIYKQSKAAYESAQNDSTTTPAEKEKLQTEWKKAKKAYKRSKNSNSPPSKSSNNNDEGANDEGDDAQDIIDRANQAYFAAESPVDKMIPKKRAKVAPVTMAAEDKETEEQEDEDEKEGEDDGETKKRKRKRKRKRKSSKEGESTPATGEERKFHSMGNKLENESLTIFVGGISYDASEEDLSEFFNKCGKIKSVRVPRYHDSGKPRGYAHIDFATSEGVNKALAKNRERMMGRYLDIKIANRKRNGGDFDISEKPPNCKTIFIKNLPYDTNEKEVFSAFQFCGKISHVRLVKWQHTNKLKGIGYVEFAKEESAEIAVKKRHEISVGGRSVLVDFEGGKPKASYRDTEGRNYAKMNSFTNKRKKGPEM
jgi:nucleolin